MKFTIETKILNDALRIASVAMMGGRATLPILGNIKIETTKDQVILSTTNLDIYVSQKLPAKVEKEGATTAPFSLLSQLTARMQSSSVSIDQQKGAIQFKSGEVTAELETLDASEFPPPLPSLGEEVECDAAAIIKPFTMLAHSIGTDPQRYMLTGINLTPSGEIIAMDGKRMAVYAGKPMTKEGAIIPDMFVKAILKIQPEGPIRFFAGSGYVTLISKQIDIAAKLIEGTFPNWKQGVPSKNGKLAFSCGRQPMIEALKTCAIFSPLKNPGLYIAGKGKEIEVSQPGKALISVLGTELAEQPKLSMKVNEFFLIDVLGILEGEDARLQVTDGISPIVIEEGKFKSVIMPMRTA